MATSRALAIGVIAVFVLVGAFMLTRNVKAAGGAVPAASTDVNLAAKPGREAAVFAGGCFWGTQSVFERVKGELDQF